MNRHGGNEGEQHSVPRNLQAEIRRFLDRDRAKRGHGADPNPVGCAIVG
jgi:hypothetical protein